MPEQQKPRPGDPVRIAGFDHAVIHGLYGDRIDRWNAIVNRDLLAVFGAADWLARDPIIDRYMKVRTIRPFTSRTFQASAKAGNLVHWGVRLGIIAERVVDGERGWALLHPTPVWAIDRTRPGRRVVQLIGAPPDVAAARAKRDAAREKLWATLDRKARAVFPSSNLLNAILEHDRGYVVPPTWTSQGPMPSWTMGKELRVVFGIAIDAHEVAGLTRRQLKHWASLIDQARIAAETRAILYKGLTPLPFEAGPEPAFHPDDDKVLASLGDLGGL